MNTYSYLNPQSMRQQCSDAIADLLRDNNIYREINSRIDNFIANTKLQSTGINALKTHLNDYKFVIRAIIAANEYDIVDYNSLSNSVGNQILVGKDIFNGKHTYNQLRLDNEERAKEYENRANQSIIFLQREYYYQKAKEYWGLAGIASRIYSAYKQKEDDYNNIDAITCQLFTRSDSLRQSAMNGLQSLATVFVGGTYVVNQNAPWKQEIMQSYADIFYITSENGEKIPNWSGIEHCLKKDAEDITSEEYDILTEIYLNLEEEEIGVFIGFCMDKGEDVEKSPFCNWGQGTITVGYEYTEWTVNEEKIKNIFGRTQVVSDSLLYVVKNAENGVEKTEKMEERNNILHRMTLLEVVLEIGDVRSSYQNETPEITTKTDDNGDVVLSFWEERFVEGTPQNYIYSLSESSITICQTENGTNITNKKIELGKEILGEYLGVNSLASESITTISEETFKYILDEYVLEDAIEIVPLLGSIAEMTMNITELCSKNEENKDFVEAYFETEESAKVYADYDCSLNFVIYNTSDKEGTILYAYEGEYTESKIQTVNQELQYEVNINDILYTPQTVWDETLELSQDSKWEEIYGQIIGNKWKG